MIRFKCRLSGAGWAVATIGDERGDITFPASYLCDALRDFLDAVQSLFVNSTAECAWGQEPGEVRWTFQRSGSRISLGVGWHDGRDKFSGDGDLLRFAAEVKRELDGLIEDWGEEGYLKHWRHPFRHEAYRRLEVGIRSELERRKTSK